MPLILHSVASDNLLTDILENILEVEQQQPETKTSLKRPVNSIPQLNVSENEAEYYVQVDLPGVSKDQIDLSMNAGNILILKGERKITLEQKDTDKYHISERTFGKFERRLRLPNCINLDDVDASLENGVLTLRYAKKRKIDEKKKILIK
ncbi:hypothetical protein HK099_006172 [Clydaea vesicula]|uniref:SHSP domain-containing protein n=1 Tax=Clydaea vesicula TaxID=447962 RepID=A0AAD5U2T0_9FUNG|nr:hypothetical protein HK099_006172 [Clydaea vesicula]KAJ3389725.1 hypothetical protein HDU92_000923 [Lobulomyces angularis]